jgi:hypothetical protein
MLKVISGFYRLAEDAVKAGVLSSDIAALPVIQKFSRLGSRPESEISSICNGIMHDLKTEIEELKGRVA